MRCTRISYTFIG